MDHNRVTIALSQISCGVLQVYNISEDIEGAAFQIGSHLYHPSRGTPAAFFIMSDLAGKGETRSDTLDAFLRKNGLVDTFYSMVEENPKTGNLIQIYVCRLRHTEFKKWYNDTRISIIKKAANRGD
jgi:hypothetical protein